MTKFASCIVFALLAATNAEPNDVAGCIMSNTGAVNQMVNSALFIYVTNRNCKKFDSSDAGVCVKDLASVVNSVSGIAEFMVKIFKTCGEVKSSNYNCAIAGTKLTGVLSSLTANTAAATVDCPVAPPSVGGNTPWSYAGASLCNVFIGGATGAIQGAVTSMMAVKAKCGGKHGSGDMCVGGVLDIISAIANLATAIENLASKCSHGNVNFANGCESDVAGIIGNLAGLASSSVAIKDSCTADSTRLYGIEEKLEEPAAFGGANLMSAMLLVLLPITGLASYYGGSRLSKGRATRRVLVPAELE
jgi:hypothetical protein